MVNFTFRIPDDLYADLKELAAADDRSVNSELLHLVRRAVGELRAAEESRSSASSSVANNAPDCLTGQ
jgi:predicted transcriptional regulator